MAETSERTMGTITASASGSNTTGDQSAEIAADFKRDRFGHNYAAFSGTQRGNDYRWQWPVVEVGSNATGRLFWKGQAKTLALALCIASLKACDAMRTLTRPQSE